MVIVLAGIKYCAIIIFLVKKAKIRGLICLLVLKRVLAFDFPTGYELSLIKIDVFFEHLA